MRGNPAFAAATRNHRSRGPDAPQSPRVVLLRDRAASVRTTWELAAPGLGEVVRIIDCDLTAGEPVLAGYWSDVCASITAAALSEAPLDEVIVAFENTTPTILQS